MSVSSSPNEPSPRKTYRTMAGAAVAIFLLLSLALYSLSRLSPSASQAIWATPLGTPDLLSSHRQVLPQFEYKEDGLTLNPSDFADHWTLVSFWSNTCAPCLVELPTLNQLAQNWQGPEFEILTVNSDVGDDLDQSKRYLRDQQIELPALFDKDSVLKTAFAVSEYPRHFLVNPAREIVWAATGAYRWTDPRVSDQLLKLMEEPAPDKSPDPAK